MLTRKLSSSQPPSDGQSDGVNSSSGGGALKKVLASRSFHSFFGVFVSVALLLWVFSEVDFSKIQDQLATARYSVFLLAFPVLALHFALRSWRWKYLLPNGESTSFMHRFDGIMVGSFANFVLPLRAGEFVRPFLLSKLTPVTFAEGFASIITERFFDLAATIITFALLLPLLPEMPDWVSTSAWVLGLVAAAILGFIVVIALAPGPILKIFDRLMPAPEHIVVKKIRRLIEDLIVSAQILADPKRLAAVLGITVVVWLSNYFLFYIYLFSLDIPQDFLIGTTVSVIIALAVAAPSAPGFIGVYQTACLASFALFHIGSEEALTYSILTHIFQYVVYIGYGVYCLSKVGLHLADLRRE